jgi:glyoxylase-like metal-dependent hydrolase (beta-lactamase superfamily II)
MYDQALTPVAEGIYQVQLPLPFALRIVNCYLLRDGDAWTIVDSGLNYPPGQAAWLAAFDALGIKFDSIRRIVLTHAHPDHYGMAGWLAERSGAPVLLSPAEQAFAARVWGGGEPVIQAVAALFRQHSMHSELIDAVCDQMRVIRPMTRPLAETAALAPGARLQIGEREFQAISTPGHSDGHLAFYCADERLLLCGDTVLTKITPNISLWPDGRPDPLADFLRTLDELDRIEVDLALPGHGPLITSFSRRLAELRAHHDERLLAVERAAGDGSTAFAVCMQIFPTEQLSAHQIRFAMAETLAHLEHLVAAGRLERLDDQSVLYVSKM